MHKYWRKITVIIELLLFNQFIHLKNDHFAIKNKLTPILYFSEFARTFLLKEANPSQPYDLKKYTQIK